MRLEDYGKKLVKNVDPLEINIIREKLENYFKNNEASVHHILLSREVSYYTVFKIKHQYKTVDNFIEFLNASFFIRDGAVVPMSKIMFLEEREDLCLEIWIDDVYFHLSPFDWGVEEL